ncbi:MAG: DMT family transporter [Pseudomonadota bacterium]
MLIVLGLAWGLEYSLLKIATRSGLSLLEIVALTAILVFAVMTLIALYRRRWPAMNWRSARFYLICAILGYLIEFPLGLIVAEKIPAGLLAVIASTSPVFTSLIAIIAKVEVVSARRLAAVGIGLAASLIVLVPGIAIPNPALLVWVLLAFGLPILFALYHNYAVFDWPGKADSWQVAHGEATIAALFVCAYLVIFGDGLSQSGNITNSAWSIGAISALTVLEIYLYFEIVRRVGAVFVSLAGFIGIFAGVVWGMILFGESHSGWVWVGIVLLSSSILLLRERGAESSE